MKSAIPVIRVSSSVAAIAFYCDQLGFTLVFVYRPDSGKEDPCYMGLSCGDAFIHVSSFESNGPTGMSVAFAVDDVDALYAGFVEKKVPIHLPPTDQTWGNREMYVRDPDDNHLAFLQQRGG